MTPRWMPAAGVLAAAFALVVTPASAQVRDGNIAGKAEPKGSASISGTIVTDDNPAIPIRRVVVTISEATSIIASRVVTSDESGRFIFRDLPAGRYSIGASRAPYLPGAYGARRAAGPGSVRTGTVIVLGDGQQIEDANVTLMRGAVVTGTVRDTDGQPGRGFNVSALYYRRDGTGRRLLTTARTATADDRGVYRIYGLAPGVYLLGARASLADATVFTDAEIRRALEAKDRPAAPSPAVRRPTLGHAPVYFPGTVDPAQATPVTLAVAEERTGVDFQIQFVSMARIEGTITGIDGKPAASVQLIVTTTVPAAFTPGPASGPRSVTDAQGRFTVNGLVPGAYTLDARIVRPAGEVLWARAELVLAGDDRSVELTLRPTLPVAGRVTFDASTLSPPTSFTGARVMLTPMMPIALPFGSVPMAATPEANGAFTIPGVIPGLYSIGITLPIPPEESGWYPISATINGQESLDGPVEIRASDGATTASVILTDRPTEVSGTITDASDRAATEYFIIIFSETESHWTPFTRRIMQTRPSHDGSFVFRNLPPGSYRLAAVTDVEQGEWRDPAFLTQLVPASIRLTLAEHGKVRQDLRIAR
jgi:hypothetical protein